MVTIPVSQVRSTSSIVGGTDPDRFDVKEAWYPVFYLTDLDKTKPTPFTLLGMDLVLWWDGWSQSWRAFADRCPHRLVPLSEGRINEEGLLECPYHGWSFAGSGDCKHIPQQNEGGQAETSRRACVKSFPTAEKQGLLFVYAGQPENAENAPVPAIEPWEEGMEGWVCLDIFRDLPYDAATLLENVLDPSHLPYTHHNTVGKRSNASPVDLELLTSDKWGFTGTWKEGPRRGKLGSQDTTFIAPNLMWHDLTSKQFGRTITAVYATPIRKGECRLFARFPFKFPSKFPALAMSLTPRWFSHLGQNSILEDDQIFLHWQERILATEGGSEQFSRAFYMPTKADRFVFEYRQWFNQYEAEPFPGESLPVRLNREALLDRYHSHTEHCASCRSALARVQQLRQGCVAIGGLAIVGTALWQNALLAGLTIVLGAAWYGLGLLEQRFYHGRSIPARNIPDKG
ncbi:Rieske 2Fe-2S domain-containing protein [Alkalinema pantanalense CENA528]|uniref:aromatic ring-hydroxylating dioxygenase subunit alpha n=1 Tax=Alkalinema pantanalense TaxID=1620705 RepID=UPI003D6FB061